ncbi:MAG: Ig-like domain-containing protein, partial [Mycobacteriales bacterium]
GIKNTDSCSISGPSGLHQSFSACASVSPSPAFTVAGSYTFAVTNNGGHVLARIGYLYQPLPAPIVAVSPTSPGSSPQPSFTFSDPVSGAFSCALTGPVSTAPAVSCASPFQVNADQGDGNYTLTVTLTAAQATASASATYELVPPAPTVTAPPSPGNATSPTFTFTDAQAGVSFACAITGPLATGAWAACTSPYTANLDQGDGSYSLSVRAVDASGSSSAATTASYQLDTLPPVVSIVTDPLSPSTSSTPQFSVSVTDSLPVTLGCVLSGPQSFLVVPATCASFSETLPTPGQYTLTVTASDLAGNQSVSSAGYDLLAPPTPPAAPVITGSASSPSSSTAPWWAFTLPTGSTGQCALYQGATQLSAPAVCANKVTYSLDAASPGTYTVQIVAVDADGLTSVPATANYVLLAPSASPVTKTTPGSPPTGGGNAPSKAGAAKPGSTKPGGSVQPKQPSSVAGTGSGQRAPASAVGGQQSASAVGGQQSASQPTQPTTSPIQAEAAGSAVGGSAVGGSAVGGSAVGGSAVGGSAVGGSAVPHGSSFEPLSGSGQFVRFAPRLNSGQAVSGPANAPGSPLAHPSPVAKPAQPESLAALVPGLTLIPGRVRRAVEGVVLAAGATKDHGAFPLALLAVLVAFLLVQSRIDRRDPKLALAPRSADERLEFQAVGGERR